MTKPDPYHCPYQSNKSSNYTYSFREAPHQNIFLKFGTLVTEWLSRFTPISVKNTWFVIKHNSLNEMFYLSWQKKDMITKCRTLKGTVYLTAEPDIMKAIFQNPKTYAEGLFWNEQVADKFLKLMTSVFSEDIQRLGLDKVINMVLMTGDQAHMRELRSPIIDVLGAGRVKKSITQFAKAADIFFASLKDKEKEDCNIEQMGFEFTVTFVSKFIMGYETTRENYLIFTRAILTIWNTVSAGEIKVKNKEEFQQAIFIIKKIIDSNISKPEPSLFVMKMKESGWDNFQIRSHLFFLYLAGAQPVSSTLNMLFSHLAKVQNKAILDRLRAPAQRENYLVQVIAEAIRMHPTFLLPEREFRKDTLFEAHDSKGKLVKRIKLLRGHLILNMIPIAAFDPKSFVNPLEFNPDRFNPDNIRSQLSWLPFGAGTHVCPGQFLGWAIIQVFISGLTDKFNIELVQPNMKKKQGIFAHLRSIPTHIKLIDR